MVRENLKQIKAIWDHRGKYVTMNGSQYDSFNHMLEIRKIREEQFKPKPNMSLKRRTSLLLSTVV